MKKLINPELNPALDRMAKSMITEALLINQGNRAAAARDLNISYKTLRWWLHKLDMAAKP